MEYKFYNFNQLSERAFIIVKKIIIELARQHYLAYRDLENHIIPRHKAEIWEERWGWSKPESSPKRNLNLINLDNIEQFLIEHEICHAELNNVLCDIIINSLVSYITPDNEEKIKEAIKYYKPRSEQEIIYMVGNFLIPTIVNAGSVQINLDKLTEIFNDCIVTEVTITKMLMGHSADEEIIETDIAKKKLEYAIEIKNNMHTLLIGEALYGSQEYIEPFVWAAENSLTSNSKTFVKK